MLLPGSSIFERIIIPVLSFFDHKGEVDFHTTFKYIYMLNQSPIRHIILFGTTGEGVSLGVSEKKALIRFYETHLSPQIHLTLCTGLWSIKDVEILVEGSSRVERILQLPTRYYERDDPRLVRFYTALSHAVPQEIVLYHLPKNTFFPFTPHDVLMYRDAGAHIAGIKLSHASFIEMAAFLPLDRFDVWYGSDKAILSTLEAGASGVVCQNLAAGFVTLGEGDDLVTIQHAADNVRHRIEQGEGNQKMKALKTIVGEMARIDVSPYVRIPNL